MGTTYVESSSPAAGCWMTGSGALSVRKLDSVMDNSVIMTDKNYRTTANLSGIVSNQAMPSRGGSYTSLSNYASYGWYAPGWNHLSSGVFLFKDGHASVCRFTGGILFNPDYQPLF
jgi:hypothetical protein